MKIFKFEIIITILSLLEIKINKLYKIRIFIENKKDV